VEGNSTDKTWEEINKQITNYKLQTNSKRKSTNFNRTIRAYKQTGKGKADAVSLGFEKAGGDIVMIYDADRTVPALDLPKFYNVLANGLGDFANGSRLVYPMEGQAMQTLNKLGNRFFSFVFTKILGQHFKDTLCGTKAVFNKDFLKMKKDYLNYLKIDPFGDFALIFSAIKHNLKVVEIPIRYKEREYGSTNIRRFYHGLLLFKLAWIALKEFKL
jgi:glycosyltransferase involved in cell wall biosynthesis